jgi:hypothetical protein
MWNLSIKILSSVTYSSLYNLSNLKNLFYPQHSPGSKLLVNSLIIHSDACLLFSISMRYSYFPELLSKPYNISRNTDIYIFWANPFPLG